MKKEKAQVEKQSGIPADLPSPDQENVYYSVKALENVFLNYFAQAKWDKIKDKLEKIYLPTFVFDDSSAPNSYGLTIYPRDGAPQSIVFDSTGSLMSENKPTPPRIEPVDPQFSILQDNAQYVHLDASYYSESKLKHSDFITQTYTDLQTIPAVDMILSTRAWYNAGYISKRSEFLEISKKILSDIFRSLPKEELEALEAHYDEVVNEIEATVSMLEMIDKGQRSSIMSLRWNRARPANYPSLSAESTTTRPESYQLESTGYQLVKSLVDLVCIKYQQYDGSIRSYIRSPKMKPLKDDAEQTIETLKGEVGAEKFPTGNASSLSQVYSDTIAKLLEAGSLQRNPIEASIHLLLDAGGSAIYDFQKLPVEFQNAFIFGGRYVFRNPNVGSEEETWIKQWYFDNFAKKIQDQDTDFSSLTEWLGDLDGLSRSCIETAKRDLIGGERLLVQQAIMKSLLKLCQNNVNVEAYAPTVNSAIATIGGGSRTESATVFELLERSPILGPTKCHQYPSRFSLPTPSEDNPGVGYNVDVFTKTGFLCYASILRLYHRLMNPGNEGTIDFLLTNLTEIDSDHDKTIDMVNGLNNGGGQAHSALSRNFMTRKFAAEGGRIQDDEGTLKNLLELFKKDEGFGGRSGHPVFLVSLGDDKIPRSDRSFFNFHMEPAMHTREGDLMGTSIPDGVEGLNPLYLQYPEILSNGFYSEEVIGEGKDSYQTVPNAWKLMGYVDRGEGTYNSATGQTEGRFVRTKEVNYGFESQQGLNTGLDSAIGGLAATMGESAEGMGSNTFTFWKHRGYNMPYYWACMQSLNRALVYGAYEELLASIEEITGQTFDVNVDFIKKTFGDTFVNMQNAVIEVVGNQLYGQTTGMLQNYISPDGSIIFGNKRSTIQKMTDVAYRNTTGTMTQKLIEDYVKFVSKVSPQKQAKMVEDHEELEFDIPNFVPPEAMAVTTNPNYKNGHGGFGNYISPDSFSTYFDPMTFTRKEVLDGSPIRKNTSALGIQNHYNELYSGYLNDCKKIHGHQEFHKWIQDGFSKFVEFIDGFVVDDVVKSVFSEGHFDPNEDIRDPADLISQIENNKLLYSANSEGISNYWNSVTLDNLGDVKFLGENAYIYVLGLKKEVFDEDGVCRILPEYYGEGKGIFLAKGEKKFNYLEPHGDSSGWTESERESKIILDYLNCVRGIHVNETTFSKKKTPIWSDLLINSESGVFPWDSKSFEEGVPIKPIDSLFYMSPVLFPRNYFYDVCLENKYHRVVGVALPKATLDQYSMEKVGRGTEIIGSIRWCSGAAIRQFLDKNQSQKRQQNQNRQNTQKTEAGIAESIPSTKL